MDFDVVIDFWERKGSQDKTEKNVVGNLGNRNFFFITLMIPLQTPPQFCQNVTLIFDLSDN